MQGLRVINRQAGEMKLQRIVTQDTLNAIKRQADVMEAQAGHMETQTGILKDSVAAAQKSADAAKTNSDIAAGVSLPKLAIHELGVGDIGVANAEAFFQYPRMKITIKNYGQTPAFLKWWCLCFSCEDLPEIPIYDGPATGMILDKIVLQPDMAYTLPQLFYNHRHEFSVEEVKAIMSRNKTFRVYGYVCYGDMFGNPLKRLKFCETVLNIFGGDKICDWWEALAPPAYAGTEQYQPKKQHNISLKI
jgi:hypothetical protein